MDVIHHECPGCTILPVKAGDEALDPTDNLAKAWQFAADEGAKVIVSVTADLGYSPFARQVLDELHTKGVVVVEASNDFDSTDHQGGMFWPYVIPGNGAVPTADGTAVGPVGPHLVGHPRHVHRGHRRRQHLGVHPHHRRGHRPVALLRRPGLRRST